MPATTWRWLRLVAGAAILAALASRVGAEPFLHGFSRVDAPAVAAALGLGAATTLACAWRWTSVARALGVGLPLRSAVAAYYRSQFLNTVLPGGVLGDVHRVRRRDRLGVDGHEGRAGRGRHRGRRHRESDRDRDRGSDRHASNASGHCGTPHSVGGSHAGSMRLP